MRATVIANRRARNLVTEGPLLSELRRPRDGVTLIETWSLQDLDQAARAIGDAEVVVLAGGDGSSMAGVTALARACPVMPSVALAPGGTTGTVGRNWRDAGHGNTLLPPRARDDVAFTRRLLDAIARGAVTAKSRPTLSVEANGEAQVGFIFAAGLAARFFEIYEAEGSGGNLGAAKIVARIFAGSFVGARLARCVLAPVPVAITVDGAPAPFARASLVAASVVRDLGLHMHLLYRAGASLDRFHTVATPLGAARLGPQMPLVLAGRRLLGPGVDTLASELVLRFPAGEGAYVLDGELERGDVVRVTPGPVLRVLGPG